jgi:hypothetical protein
MAEDAIFHRTLWDVTKLARPAARPRPDPFFSPPGRQPLTGSLSGYQKTNTTLRPVDLIKKPCQDFHKYATVWERYWSTLCDFPDGINSFEPVVGPNDQFGMGYPIVGHIGAVGGDHILVPRGYGGNGQDLRTLLNDVPAFISGMPWAAVGDWVAFGTSEDRFTVLTGVDGTILIQVAHDVVGLVKEDPIMDIIEGKVLTDLGTLATKKLIRGLFRRVWGPIMTAETRLKLLKEALAKQQSRRFVGKLTAEEMNKHLTSILEKHPELRRLMAARVLTKQRLTSATIAALGDWEQLYGRRVAWKSEAEMVARTGNPKNLMTHQGNELWINQEAKELKVAQTFYQEAVHELAADSLGIRGSAAIETYLDVLGPTRFSSDFFLLENAILQGDVEKLVEKAVRLAAGK